jgi:hypothetical protein
VRAREDALDAVRGGAVLLVPAISVAALLGDIVVSQSSSAGSGQVSKTKTEGNKDCRA